MMLEQIKDQFRVRRDEQGDPRLECRNGFVYDHGAKSLGVWINSRRPLRSFEAIRTLWPTVRLVQMGDAELTMVFEPADMPEAVRFLRSIGAHRRRKLSQEHKEKLAESNKSFRFASRKAVFIPESSNCAAHGA